MFYIERENNIKSKQRKLKTKRNICINQLKMFVKKCYVKEGYFTWLKIKLLGNVAAVGIRKTCFDEALNEHDHNYELKIVKNIQKMAEYLFNCKE